MVKQGKAKLAELQKRLDKEFAQIVSTETGDGPDVQQLSNAVISLGIDFYDGSVAYAGQSSSGSYHVQFNTGNTGYASTWPQWAFDQAKSALLYGKKLWVFAAGEPFGTNLLQVLILSGT